MSLVLKLFIKFNNLFIFNFRIIHKNWLCIIILEILNYIAKLYLYIVRCIRFLLNGIFLLFINFIFNSISYSYLDNDVGSMNSGTNGNNNPEVIIIMIIIYSIFKAYQIYSTFSIPPFEKNIYINPHPHLDLKTEEEPEGIYNTDIIKEFIDICNNNPSILIYIFVASIFTCIFFYKFVYLKHYKKKLFR